MSPDDRARARDEAIATLAAQIAAAAARHGRTPAEIGAQVIVDGFGGFERWPQPEAPR